MTGWQSQALSQNREVQPAFSTTQHPCFSSQPQAPSRALCSCFQRSSVGNGLGKSRRLIHERRRGLRKDGDCGTSPSQQLQVVYIHASQSESGHFCPTVTGPPGGQVWEATKTRSSHQGTGTSIGTLRDWPVWLTVCRGF